MREEKVITKKGRDSPELSNQGFAERDKRTKKRNLHIGGCEFNNEDNEQPKKDKERKGRQRLSQQVRCAGAISVNHCVITAPIIRYREIGVRWRAKERARESRVEPRESVSSGSDGQPTRSGLHQGPSLSGPQWIVATSISIALGDWG